MNTKSLIPNLPNPRWYCWLQMKSLLVFPENIFEGKLLKIKFTKRRDVFVPRTWSGCYNLISEFSIAKVWFCLGLYWSTRVCNLAAHSSIHSSFILRRGLTRFQLLRPETNRVQEFFWYTGMRLGCLTDRKHHNHCS